jgi:hypothetical protein
MTPVERLYGKKPLVNHLHVFGFVSWANIPDDRKNNFEAHIHSFIMMGYSEELKSYRLFDPFK